MDNLATWLTPLILLPGVAMLVLSTSIRYGQIHDEFHHLHQHKGDSPARMASHLLERSRLFRNALVSLYIGIALFSSGSFVGGLVEIWFGKQLWIVAVMTCGGILSVVYAAITLIRESAVSLKVISEHCTNVRDN